ncbi:MAG TPA: CoA transferase, partial [Dehalococcoidia bacterium]
MAGPLNGIRVLDLANARAELAGRVLADLGAEVIKVEPPDGVDSRRLPPFDASGESLYWRAVALGKRSLSLDITMTNDRDELRRLVAGADVLIESFDPGYMESLGLGYESLCAVNPALIHVSVTPWGQSGPLADAPATELTLETAGGLVALQGDADRPPIPVGFPQAAFHAGVQAAADAAIALNERDRSGLGQHLDVSMQAAVVWTLMNATGYPPNEGRDPPGFGDDRADARPVAVPGLRPMRAISCADGLVAANFTQGRPGEATFLGLLAWLREDGDLPPAVEGADFSDWLARVRSGDLSLDLVNEAIDALHAFLAKKTKAQVLDTAVRYGLLLAPYFTVRDLVADRQLRARRYWRKVGANTYPGPFARMSRTPIRLRNEAPVRGEMAAPPSWPRRRMHAEGGEREQAFRGLRVADFAWVGVGPIISKALADHGATVVHVESATRPDVLRAIPPFKDGVPGIDRSQFMPNFNSSKLGLALDMSKPAAVDLARRLTGWADVVV